MGRLIRGNAIKLLDEQVEAAAFRILTGVYIHLVHIEDTCNLDEVLFIFKEYIYREYENLYKLANVKHDDSCKHIENRVERYKKQDILIPPSEILSELEYIKGFKKLIHDQEVSSTCLPCIKLKWWFKRQ
jgi:hypothetical protein